LASDLVRYQAVATTNRPTRTDAVHQDRFLSRGNHHPPQLLRVLCPLRQLHRSRSGSNGHEHVVVVVSLEARCTALLPSPAPLPRTCYCCGDRGWVWDSGPRDGPAPRRAKRSLQGTLTYGGSPGRLLGSRSGSPCCPSGTCAACSERGARKLEGTDRARGAARRLLAGRRRLEGIRDRGQPSIVGAERSCCCSSDEVRLSLASSEAGGEANLLLMAFQLR